jgi:dipeptidyl aminopeptidase/acylaminoacyl peptidase
MNADGAARTALLTNGCSTSSSSWAPFGNGTTAAPFRVLNVGICNSEAFAVADVDTAGGAIHARNVQHVHFAGDWWATQDPTARHYGQPAWKPGAGDEIVLAASWQSNPATNEWVSALYIFATTELPNPTPQLLYQAPSGCTDAVRPAWSPDGTSIAFVESCGAAGDGIKVLDRATGGVTTALLHGTLGGFGPLDWSPSGERLGFSAGGSVYTLRLTPGSAPERIASGFGASWSSDAADSRLAFNTTKRSKVSVIDFVTGNTTSLGSGEQPAWRR